MTAGDMLALVLPLAGGAILFTWMFTWMHFESAAENAGM